MAKFTSEQLQKGRTRFLDGHRDIKARIDALTQQEADALGITLEHLREIETMRELRDVAHIKNIDSQELFWSYLADTAAELGEMLERRDAAEKRALGI